MHVIRTHVGVESRLHCNRSPMPFSVFLSSTQLWFAREFVRSSVGQLRGSPGTRTRLEMRDACVYVSGWTTLLSKGRTRILLLLLPARYWVFFFFFTRRGKGTERNGLMGHMNRSSLRFGDNMDAPLRGMSVWATDGLGQQKQLLPLGGLLQLITRWLIRGTPLSFPTSELAFPLHDPV